MYKDSNKILFFSKEDCKFNDSSDERIEKLKTMGYQSYHAFSKQDGSHTIYYYNPDAKFTFIKCYFGNIDKYTQLIISTSIIKKLNVIRDSLCGSTCLKYADYNTKKSPSGVIYTYGKVHLATATKTKGRTRWLSFYGIQNIVDENLVFDYTIGGAMKEEPYIFPGTYMHDFNIQKESDVFLLSIRDLYPNDAVETALKSKYEKVRWGKSSTVIIKQTFPNEVQAIMGYASYCKEFYGKYYIEPIYKYLSDNFNVAFKYLVTKEISKSEVEKRMLKEYADDCKGILLTDLASKYDELGYPYIHAAIDKDGYAIPDFKNKEEVEMFKRG